MATGAVIGALRVNLGLDSAQFQSGLKSSQSGMQNFAKAAAAGFAAAAAAATGAFMAIQGAAQRADDAFKASQSFGIPIEQLGRLQFAAEMSGSSLEEIGKAAQRTSRAVNDSMNGMVNAGTRAFDQLGVALTNADGTARDVEGILGDVAERFANMPDGAQKTALAIEMFGRTGSNLIPTLNMGRDGLREMGDEAERLGLVFDERTGRASEVFNDNMARLSATMTGLWNQVLVNVIGGFADLTNKIIAATQQGGQLDMVVKGISIAMNLLARGVGVVIDNLSHLWDIFVVFMGAAIVSGIVSMARAFITFSKAIRTAGFAMVFLTSITRAKITAIALLGAVIAKVTGTYDDLVGWIQGIGQQLMNALPEGLRSGIEDVSHNLENMVYTTGLLEGEIDGLDSSSTALSGTMDGLGGSAGGAGSALSGVGDAAEDADAKMQKFGVSAEQITSTLANGFTNMFTSALDGSKSLMSSIGDLLKSLGSMFLNAGFQALFSMGGGGLFSGIGNFFSGLFGGARAAGGPVTGGKSYLVGERGPELFTPGTSGNITANHKLEDRRPTQINLIVEEGTMFAARVQQIAGEGDVRVVKSIERGLPGMMAEAQMRQG